jgi:hypothetical protein
MAISPTNIQTLFTNYDIITYFLNLASCSEHFISIKHRISATFNIKYKPKKINRSDCMPLRPVVTIKVFFVKENFNKVFNETLIVTTVKEIFDQKL